MGRLTTHVLDTARGRPASGMTVELYRLGKNDERLSIAETNSDGRVSGALLEGEALSPGIYELRFHVGDYLRRTAGEDSADFLGIVPIRFGIRSAEEHYHVPLLVAPYGYSTYRGS